MLFELNEVGNMLFEINKVGVWLNKRLTVPSEIGSAVRYAVRYSPMVSLPKYFNLCPESLLSLSSPKSYSSSCPFFPQPRTSGFAPCQRAFRGSLRSVTLNPARNKQKELELRANNKEGK